MQPPHYMCSIYHDRLSHVGSFSAIESNGMSDKSQPFSPIFSFGIRYDKAGDVSTSLAGRSRNGLEADDGRAEHDFPIEAYMRLLTAKRGTEVVYSSLLHPFLFLLPLSFLPKRSLSLATPIRVL